MFEFLLDQCSLDAEALLGFLFTQHESLMAEGATSEKVVNECAAKAISNPGEIGKVDKETNLPTSVDEVADVALPTGGGENQGVVASSNETPADEVAIEGDLYVHPFWLLLKQAGYT